ncbi:diguanylate cyclase [Marinobacterium lacunae]|uniref:diguanylate cyclase n=1 Tax=Marinobacterium lacunae TaxID=1232683 RepID=A0A081G2J2_9GAMM|nr:GGDEF domain-containing protein [Marinobacterium lacunae]KEA64997.1 diguanylate cyclase [Marinobacterium lacunae]MBR9882317.1 GGDEF domain-containing protein [Oceanospirillales bacterium]
MGLRTKFLSLLAVIACGFMAYVHFLVIPIAGQQALDIAEGGHASQLQLVSEAITPPLLESDIASVYEMLNAIKEDNPSWLRITLYSPKGDRLYPLADPEPIDPKLPTLTLTKSVGFLNPAIGKLNISIDMTPSIGVAHQLEHSLLTGLTVLLVLLLVAIWFEVEIIIRRPLNLMVKAARKLIHGDYEAELPLHMRGEIGELATTFSDMRRTIERHHIDMAEELETEKQRAAALNQQKQQAEFEATHDMLTGLLNRREFYRQLDELLEQIQSGDAPHGTLLYIDLDHFKTVNDSCGHPAGDELLKQITREIRTTIRGDDVFARLGGDEFAVLLKRCNEMSGVRVANTICTAVKAYTFSWGDQNFSVGASIGVTELKQSSEGIEAALASADAACYAAKRDGRNRVSIGEEIDTEKPDMTPANRANIGLEPM